MESFIIIIAPCPNGHWQASIQTIGGRIFKTGAARSSQEEALGNLVLSYPEYCNIREVRVANLSPKSHPKNTSY